MLRQRHPQQSLHEWSPSRHTNRTSLPRRTAALALAVRDRGDVHRYISRGVDHFRPRRESCERTGLSLTWDHYTATFLSVRGDFALASATVECHGQRLHLDVATGCSRLHTRVRVHVISRTGHSNGPAPGSHRELHRRAAPIDCAQVNFAADAVRIQWQSSPAGRAHELWSARSTLVTHDRKQGQVLFHRFNGMTLVAVVLLAQSAVAAADLATYRDFTLGMSTAEVLAHAQAVPRDVNTLHQRPALLQDLSWRPPYMATRDSTGRDSVAVIVFSFVDDQLFKMAIDYDGRATEGLTKADIITALSGVYGPPSTRATPPTPRPAFDSLDTRTTVARWSAGDTAIALTESAYSRTFGLVITSVPLDALARRAQATAVALDAREAPAREAARTKAQADAARDAAEQTRITNRATFKP